MSGGSVESLAWSPDGRLLAAGIVTPPTGDDSRALHTGHEVLLWDAKTNDWTHTLRGHTSMVTSMAFLPGGKLLATSSRSEVKLWDIESGAFTRNLAGPPITKAILLGLSPDGQLVSDTSGAALNLWDLRTGALRWREPPPKAPDSTDQSPILSAAFSQDGKALAVGRFGGVSVWEMPGPGANPQMSGRLKTQSGIVSLAVFSPDGSTLAIGGLDGAVALCDVDDREAIERAGRPLRGLSRGVHALAFSDDGQLLAAAGGLPPNEGNGDEIRVWDVETGALRQRLVGHEEPVKAVAFRPGGGYPRQRVTLASGGDDGTIRLWPMR
jgi:WD40 repeat protein